MNQTQHYVEPYGIGGFLKSLGKGIGSLGAGLLGNMIVPGLGFGLGSGLFSGLTEGSLKKGILSGLTAYVGSKALTDAAKVAQVAESGARQQAAKKAAEAGIKEIGARAAGSGVERFASHLPNTISMPAEIAAVGARQAAEPGLREGIRALASSAGRRGAADSLSSAENLAFVYPQMGQLSASISEEERRNRDANQEDPYEEELARAMRMYRRKHGENPWSNLYGYRSGAIVHPTRDGYAGGGLLDRRYEYDYLLGLDRFGSSGEGGEDIYDRPSGDPDGRNRREGDGGGVTRRPTGDGPADDAGEGGDLPMDDDRETGSGGNLPGDGQLPEDERDQPGDDDEWTPQGPYPRYARPIPDGFIPGLMPEYDYFGSTATPKAMDISGFDAGPDPFAEQQVADAIDAEGLASYIADTFAPPVEGMADGGVVGEELQAKAVQALLGQLPHEEASMVIEEFRNTFGPEALEALMQMIMAERSKQKGTPPKTEGLIQGPGGGMGDQIIADVAGADPVALSSGEFVIPSDVVSMLGDGDTSSGAAKLDKMMKDVRREKTGTTKQAPPMQGIMALR